MRISTVKRFLALALVLLLMLSFTACGEDDDDKMTVAAHSIKVKDELYEHFNIPATSYRAKFSQNIQDVDCSKTVSGINCSVTQSLSFGYDIVAVVEIAPEKDWLKRNYPNGLTASEVEVLSNGKSVSSDFTVVSDLIFFNDTKSNAVLIQASSNSPDFDIGNTITLKIKGISPIGSDDSIEIKKPIKLEWTVADAKTPSPHNLKSDKICGNVVITPLSLHLELTESPYDSAEKLLRSVKINPYHHLQSPILMSEYLEDPSLKFTVSDSDGVQRCYAMLSQNVLYQQAYQELLFYIGETNFLV